MKKRMFKILNKKRKAKLLQELEYVLGMIQRTTELQEAARNFRFFCDTQETKDYMQGVIDLTYTYWKQYGNRRGEILKELGVCC